MRLTWRPKIVQRQWLRKQRLYGYRTGPSEPETEITADEADEQAEFDDLAERDERMHRRPDLLE